MKTPAVQGQVAVVAEADQNQDHADRQEEGRRAELGLAEELAGGQEESEDDQEDADQRDARAGAGPAAVETPAVDANGLGSILPAS